MDWNQTRQSLLKELNRLLEAGLNPQFTMRKMNAAIEEDVSAYCKILEEELEVKSQTLKEYQRTGELNADIIERLRLRIQQDEKRMDDLIHAYESYIHGFHTCSVDHHSN